MRRFALVLGTPFRFVIAVMLALALAYLLGHHFRGREDWHAPDAPTEPGVLEPGP